MLITRFPRSGFNPAVFSPTMWLDVTSGITTVSGKVSQWVDRAGGFTFAQPSSGARPTYSSTGWGGSIPSVLFGSGAYTDMRCNTAGLADVINSAAAITMAITIRFGSTGAQQNAVEWNDGGSQLLVWGVNSSGNELLDCSGAPSVPTGSAMGHTNQRIFWRRNNVSNGTDSYVNASVSYAAADTAASITGANQMCIGGNPVIGAGKLAADLVEVILFMKDLPPAIYGPQYYAYSVARWGL